MTRAYCIWLEQASGNSKSLVTCSWYTCSRDLYKSATNMPYFCVTSCIYHRKSYREELIYVAQLLNYLSAWALWYAKQKIHACLTVYIHGCPLVAFFITRPPFTTQLESICWHLQTMQSDCSHAIILLYSSSHTLSTYVQGMWARFACHSPFNIHACLLSIVVLYCMMHTLSVSSSWG